MPRPSRLTEKRRELLPVVAAAFAELGYRRASTAELARRCRVQELILYRLWPDKKSMFLAAIEHVFERSLSAWMLQLSRRPAGQDALAALLEYEAGHHGEHGLYRIVFAGLGECDDPGVRAALRSMYSRFQRFIVGQIDGSARAPAARTGRRTASGAATHELGASEAAWGLVGLGTVTSILRELGLLGAQARRGLFLSVSRRLTEPAVPSNRSR